MAKPHKVACESFPSLPLLFHDRICELDYLALGKEIRK